MEWGVDGIRVVGIAPGPIANTPGTTKLAPGMDGNVIEEMIAEGIPLGRMGKGVDIGMVGKSADLVEPDSTTRLRLRG